MKTVEFNLETGVNIPWSQLDEWQRKSNQYTATIEYEGRSLTTPFFTGSGWKQEPTWKDVLGSLITDADCYINSRDYTDFCNEFGYNPEEPQYKKIYQACRKTAAKLKQVFGPDLWEIAETLREEGY